MDETEHDKDINRNDSDKNASSTPEDIENNSCQFLKCNPKEKNEIYLEPSSDNLNSENINKHDVLKRTPCNDDNASSQIPQVQNNDEEDRRNKIFAKQNENGNWLLRWNVEKQSEGDFIALCYEGKVYFDRNSINLFKIQFESRFPNRMFC